MCSFQGVLNKKGADYILLDSGPRKFETQCVSCLLDGKQGIPLSRQARSLQFLAFFHSRSPSPLSF